MQALKEVRKVAKTLGISSFRTLKGTKKAKSIEELQREIHTKIVKQQARISKDFIKTCKQVLKSVRSSGTRKLKQPAVPRFQPQVAVLKPPPPPATKPPPPPPPPPPLLKKKMSPRKSPRKSPKKSSPKLGIREQLMKELKNRVAKGDIKRLS